MSLFVLYLLSFGHESLSTKIKITAIQLCLFLDMGVKLGVSH